MTRTARIPLRNAEETDLLTPSRRYLRTRAGRCRRAKTAYNRRFRRLARFAIAAN